ncbi:EboA domain-containing protein [Microbispora rosea]|uniref:EboA domain-containing protein n=1 Tax=Microbispora rosea TaxID=58117 RepID=UPI0004C39028|nr:EboA domain-containing protein [Microbispora rosea]
MTWLARAVADVERDPETVYAVFPRAAREGGPGARAELLRTLTKTVQDPVAAITKLYWQGDAGERLEILESLPQLDLGPAALLLVHDALRTNDTRLVAAALGPYGSAWLDDHAFRQGVLKCVFMSVPLTSVEGLDRRFDEELRRMLADFAAERRAAGRPVPPDVLERL